MKEDLIQMTGCDDEEQLSVTPVFAEMPDLEEAGRLLKEHQKENIAKDIRKDLPSPKDNQHKALVGDCANSLT